jgi:hypothetical protein
MSTLPFPDKNVKAANALRKSSIQDSPVNAEKGEGVIAKRVVGGFDGLKKEVRTTNNILISMLGEMKVSQETSERDKDRNSLIRSETRTEGPAKEVAAKILGDTKLAKDVVANPLLTAVLSTVAAGLLLFGDKLKNLMDSFPDFSLPESTPIINEGIVAGAPGIIKGVDAAAKASIKTAKETAELAAKTAANLASNSLPTNSIITLKSGTTIDGDIVRKASGELITNKSQIDMAKAAARTGLQTGTATVTSKLAPEVVTDNSAAISKAIAKYIPKAAGKAAARALPFVGLGVGTLLAAQKLWNEDYTGAGLEFGAGLAGMVPVIGTAGSIGLSTTAAGREIYHEVHGTFPEDDPPELREKRMKEVAEEVRKELDKLISDKEGSPVKASGSADVKAEISSYLKEKGLDQNQIAGIMANIEAESSFNPAAIGDNGTSGGLFQHHGPRFDALKEAVPDWESNIKGQVDFALSEKAGKSYAATSFDNERDSADYWTRKFEIPKNVDSAAAHRSRLASNYIEEASLERQARSMQTPAPPIVNVAAPNITNNTQSGGKMSSGGITTQQNDDSMSILVKDMIAG